MLPATVARASGPLPPKPRQAGVDPCNYLVLPTSWGQTGQSTAKPAAGRAPPFKLRVEHRNAKPLNRLPARLGCGRWGHLCPNPSPPEPAGPGLGSREGPAPFSASLERGQRRGPMESFQARFFPCRVVGGGDGRVRRGGRRRWRGRVAGGVSGGGARSGRGPVREGDAGRHLPDERMHPDEGDGALGRGRAPGSASRGVRDRDRGRGHRGPRGGRRAQRRDRAGRGRCQRPRGRRDRRDRPLRGDRELRGSAPVARGRRGGARRPDDPRHGREAVRARLAGRRRG